MRRDVVLFSAENAIQDASFSERASQTSALRRSSQPLEFSGCRYVCNVAGSLTAQFAELEGSRFEYRPLFSLATERVVNTYILLTSFCIVWWVVIERCS